MSGNAYIVFDDNSNKRKLYGKNINPATTMANSGLSEYQIYKMNRGKIRNLVMYDDYQESTSDHQYCDSCKQRRIPQTKQQLLSTYNQNVQQTARIDKECIDGKSYSWCPQCGNIDNEHKSEIVPIQMGSHMCVKCQHTITMGKRLTLKPTLMYENPDDEKKPIKLGEPTATSPKRWYYHCSACGYREEMRKSSLKKKYVEQSFVRSLESSLDRSRKKLMHKEDVEDIKPGLGGTPTLLVDERDVPAPGY